MIYEVSRDNDTSTLYRVSNSGTRREVLRVIDTATSRLFIASESFAKSYRLRGVKLVRKGSMLTAVVSKDLKVFRVPHHNEFNRVIMSENTARYSLADARYKQRYNIEPGEYEIDDAGILENMLDCIATV